jgi:Fe-S-cluster containining protein
MSEPVSPCQSCGACCASFRVDFHPAELAGGAFENTLHKFGCRKFTTLALGALIGINGRYGINALIHS